MKIVINTLVFIILSTGSVLLIFGCSEKNEVKTKPTDQYEASWSLLKEHEEAPKWFRDAKFGIYFHWGVYSVPAYGDEWYPRKMHLKDQDIHRHHLETYGDPSEFGYYDFIPMFKAENFDADEWADFFVRAGARFAGLVAEHHDGFALWDSDLTPWNAVKKGPNVTLPVNVKKLSEPVI